MWRNRFLYPFLTFMLAASAFAQPGGDLKPGFNLFSKQQDIQLGREAAQQVRKQYQVVHNQFLQDYLNRVGQRLAATPQAVESGFPFSFTVVNDPSINAFALPGGPMFVNTGLLKAVDNEAQLAGVMGHEMSHVILRHGTNQASKQNLLQIPALLAGAVLGNGSLLGQLAQAGVGFGFNSVLLKFSRTDESQADRLGARLMAEAGYNPIELARFFEKLGGEAGSRAPEFLSDHPNPGNREQAIEQEIRTFPQQDYGYQTGEFERAKQMAATIPPPPKQTAGAAPSAPSDPPSSDWQELRAQKFTVSFPYNWQCTGADSSMVTIAPRDGLVQTQNGGTSVGLGAILSYFFPDTSPQNLQNATDDLIHHLKFRNPGLRVSSGSSRQVGVNGSTGVVTILEGNSPFGGEETDALLTVSRPEGLFYLIFIAPERSYRTLEGTFQKMVRSLRFS
jgi:Zn-dependent protease with chaperone function